MNEGDAWLPFDVVAFLPAAFRLRTSRARIFIIGNEVFHSHEVGIRCTLVLKPATKLCTINVYVLNPPLHQYALIKPVLHPLGPTYLHPQSCRSCPMLTCSYHYSSTVSVVLRIRRVKGILFGINYNVLPSTITSRSWKPLLSVCVG